MPEFKKKGKLKMKNEKIINLTPHNVNEVVSGQAFAPSGQVVRVSSAFIPSGTLDGIPLFVAEFGKVEGLPEPQGGVRYIVSGMVLSACPGRKDLLGPGELVRDKSGKPVGCKGFKVN
jgi:hypothetical protein